MSLGYEFLTDDLAQSPHSAMGLSDLDASSCEGPTGGYVGLFYEPGSEAEEAEATEIEEPVDPINKTLST